MTLLSSINRFSTSVPDGSPSGYTITRYSSSGYASNGEANAGTSSTFTLAASDCVVQPYGGRKLIVLPEGTRAQDVRMVHTSTPLQMLPPDRITISGEQFAVFQTDAPFNMSGVTFYRCYVARVVVP